MLSVDEICKRICYQCGVTRATTSHRLNYMTVGVPSMRVPEEAVGPGTDGVVFLPARQEREFTFRIDPGDDFIVERITCQLFTLVGQPGARTLLQVPVGDGVDGGVGVAGSIPADVRFDLYAADARRDMNDQQSDWTHFAGSARYPNPVQPPMQMLSSRVYMLRARNFEFATDFAVSFVLHGKLVRAKHPERGWTLDDTHLVNRLYGAAYAAGEIIEGPLTHDYQRNLSTCGAYKVLHVPGITPGSPIEDPDGPFVLPAGSIDTPIVVTGKVLATERYAFQATSLMGRQVVQGSPMFAIPDSTLCVMVRMFDNQAQFWLSNGFVPMTAMLGDGGRPYLLWPTWSLGRGANITVELLNYSAEILEVDLDVEGYFRDARVC